MLKPTSAPDVLSLVRTIRGQRVMLDSDLAKLYGVTTSAVNQSVKRNSDRFPSVLCFQLTREELRQMLSQSVITSAQDAANKSIKYSRSDRMPLVFIEYGALMAATVLNCARAVQMSIFINHEEFGPLTSQITISNMEELSNKGIDTYSSQNATSSTRPREARYDFESQLNYIEIVTIMRPRSHLTTLKSGQWPNPSLRRNGFPS